MGDMAAVFNDMKAATNERREKRAKLNSEELVKRGIPAVEQSKNVFRVVTHAGAVMYYPGSNSWQFRGKLYRGGITQFQNWIEGIKAQEPRE